MTRKRKETKTFSGQSSARMRINRETERGIQQGEEETKRGDLGERGEERRGKLKGERKEEKQDGGGADNEPEDF